MIAISMMIAIPISWYAMHQWLLDFAYRIELGPQIFLLAGFIALVVALATVSWQSIKAAMVNPVKSLKSE